MVIIGNPTYDELRELYARFFHLPMFGDDATEKLALISLICHLTKSIQKKKSNTTCFDILKQLNDKGNCGAKEEWLMGLSIICTEVAYGCTSFPTFELNDKDIPKKIVELLKRWLPF